MVVQKGLCGPFKICWRAKNGAVLYTVNRRVEWSVGGGDLLTTQPFHLYIDCSLIFSQLQYNLFLINSYFFRWRNCLPNSMFPMVGAINIATWNEQHLSAWNETSWCQLLYFINTIRWVFMLAIFSLTKVIGQIELGCLLPPDCDGT